MSKTVGASRRLGGCGVSYGFFLAPDTDSHSEKTRGVVHNSFVYLSASYTSIKVLSNNEEVHKANAKTLLKDTKVPVGQSYWKGQHSLIKVLIIPT